MERYAEVKGQPASLLSGMAEVEREVGSPWRSGWGRAGAERDPGDPRGEPAVRRRRKGLGCRGRVKEEPAAPALHKVGAGGEVGRS